MSNLIELKPVNKVQDIICKFCYTIGMIPTSYKLGLTVEEQILAIGKYLEETVIPALNNNAEAVVELQNLYIELKNYVDNYFDNLDVQDEINNKIDDLVNDGTFSEIVEPLLQNLQEAILNLNNTKRDKSVLIGMGDLSQEVKTAMTGGSVAVVGNQSVNNSSVQNFSLSPLKFNSIINYSDNLLDLSNLSDKYYNSNGEQVTGSYYCTDYFIEVNDVVLNQTQFYTNVTSFGWVLFNSNKEFIQVSNSNPLIIDNENVKYLKFNIGINNSDLIYGTAYILRDNKRNLTVNKLNMPNFTKNNNFLIDTDNIIGNSLAPDNLGFIKHTTNNLFNKYLADKKGRIDNSGYYHDNSVDGNSYGCYIMTLPSYIANETVFYQNTLATGFINFYDIDFNWLGHLDSPNDASFTIPYENAVYIAKSLPISRMDTYYLIAGSNQLTDYYQFNNDIVINNNSILFNKKIGFLGDSITYGLNATNPYPNVIQSNTQCTSVNYGVSGNSIAKAGSNAQENAQTNPMCIRYENMANDLDYILVFGGTNDYEYQIPLGSESSTNIEEFYGGLNTLISGLIEKYPRKTIIIFNTTL